MEEAYILCNEIAIVDRGKIIQEGPPQELLQSHYKGMMVSFPEEQKLPELPWKLHKQHNRQEFHTENPEETLKWLLENKVSLEKMEIRSKTLDDLFIDLTGHGLRDA